MKHLIWIFLGLFLFDQTSTLARGGGYEIKLQVNGATAGTAILANYYGHTNQVQDSAEVEQGNFSFVGEQSLPQGMYIVVLPGRTQYFDLIIDEDQQFELISDTTDLVRLMEVEGSKENSVFYNHVRFMGEQQVWASQIQEQLQSGKGDSIQTEKLLETLNNINQAVEEERTSIQMRYPDLLVSKIFRGMDPPKIPEAPEDAAEHFAYYYYKAHFFDQVDFSDDRLLRSPVLDTKVQTYLDEVIVRQTDTIIDAVDMILAKARANDEVFQYFCSRLLNKYGKLANEIMDMDRVYVHIVETYYAAGEAWWIEEAALKNIIEQAQKLSPALINHPGADLIAPDSTGTPRNLYSVEGKLIILYLWSYQCGFCKTATPKLVEIYRQYKDQGLGLYTINTEGTEEGWKKKLREYGMGGVHVYDPDGRSGYHQKYNSRMTPGIFILDENKIIRYKRISVDQLGEILEREFDQ
ncbi:MAG: DUF5106 domain-containing protein [Bacteroidota bacterium]